MAERRSNPERPVAFLVVEDDADYVASLEAMIRASTHQAVAIDVALSVAEALDRLHHAFYDVCFLDYFLQNGETGLDILRQLDAPRMVTAFIFLTAHEKKDAIFEALRLGAMDYMRKAKFDEFDLAKSISFARFRKHREVELQTLALRDALTGLGNRMLFEEELGLCLRQAKREEGRVGVIYVDINGFKPVNDEYGHAAGDEMLKQIAERLVETTRKSDVLARIGGDEFAAVLVRLQEGADADMVAKNIENTLTEKPYRIDGINLMIGASVGTAVYPDDSEDIHDLVRIADMRMFENKRAAKARPDSSIDWRNPPMIR